jgi:CRISPR/Cas system-associated exonuclease Cas4 (RecB family)
METKRPLSQLKDLTKSKLKDLDTCPTLFYLSEYHRDLKEAYSEKTQSTFDNGRLIENIARTQFCLSIPLFTNILDKEPSLKESLKEIISKQLRTKEEITQVLEKNKQCPIHAQVIIDAMDLVVEVIELKNEDKRKKTEEFLAQGKIVIFEAAFKGTGLTHIQADILYKREDGTFDAIEVKSGSEKKAIDEYTLDCSIQHGVINRQSIKLNKIYLWAVKTSEYNQETDLFTSFEMNEIALVNQEKFTQLEIQGRAVQQLTEMPKPVYKTECSSCPFFNNVCGKGFSENTKHVYNLPRFKGKWDLMNKGVMEVDETFLSTPPTFKTQKEEKEFLKQNPHIAYTQKNKEIINAVLTNTRYVNVAGLKEEISQWKFPLRFFDFEAFMDAVPLFKNTRPYEAVVTQFSCHKLDKESTDIKDLTHSEWLHESKENPKSEAVKQIIAHLGTEGSIVSYNKTYEETRIKDLIKDFPELKETLEAIILRIVDLKDPIESHTYDPQFFGSYSLKVVSPVLLDIENGCYNDVNLKSGANYNPAYLQMVNSTDENEKNAISLDMKKYCYYDTLNLFLIYKWILEQINKGNTNV